MTLVTLALTLVSLVVVQAIDSMTALAAPAGSRVAILVGANRPGPGRKPLMHAHRDAEQLGATLVAVGQFRPEAVHVLRDPDPASLLAVVERAAGAMPGGADSLLYFYYSGHADDQAIYPDGRPLPMEVLRGALERTRAAVRIGMIDACRGGAWTRAKGFTVDVPFEVQLPLNPSSEGSVLIASSSGSESAHESDVLQGSFFTHHFIAALRGAGDRSENGEVTLSEAFDHARAFTIRDTARVAREPQHPSYAVNLRGRQDLVLAQVARSPSRLTVAQANGPLDVIHLETGLALVELAPGRRRTRLAVPPGRYLVRKAGPTGNLAREVLVGADSAIEVNEADLVLVAMPRLSLKGDEPLPLFARSTLPGRTIGIGIGVGFGLGWSGPVEFLPEETEPRTAEASASIDGFLQWAITDRLSWAVLTGAFAYRLGDPGGWEVVPAGGLVGWGISSVEGFIAQLAAQAAVRRWFGPAMALHLEAGAFSQTSDNRSFGQELRAEAALGWSQTVANVVTFNFGVSGHLEQLPAGLVSPRERNWWLGFGSVQSIGLRTLPLVQLHLRQNLALDLHARLRRDLGDGRWQYATLLGGSFAF